VSARLLRSYFSIRFCSLPVRDRSSQQDLDPDLREIHEIVPVCRIESLITLKNVRRSRVGGQIVRDADVAVGFWPELQFRKRSGVKKDDAREREREGGS